MGVGREGISRRSFLRVAGAAAGTAALSGVARAAEETAADPSADKRPLKLGIIGTGWQGKVLMKNALKVPGIEFVAICDIVSTRMDQAQQVLTDGGREKAKTYADYHELLKDKNIQAVVIATPLHMHAPIAIDAFKAGFDVFCEKCMARTIDECKAMLTAKGDHMLQIGHHLRYHPIYHIAKARFIDSGLLGDRINNIHCAWNRNGAWRKAPEEGVQVPFGQWGFANPDELWNWRLYKKFSGGLMTELASHQLDVMNWYLGDQPPVAISGVGRIDNKDGRTIFDNVHLIYEYPSDVQMTYESITTNAFNPYGWEAYEMIQGNKGTLILTHLGNPLGTTSRMGYMFLEPGQSQALWMMTAPKVKFDTGNLRKEYTQAVVVGKPAAEGQIAGFKLSDLVDAEGKPTKETYELEFYDFKRAVLDRKEPFCNGEVGLKSAIPALLGYEAMEKQARLVVPEGITSLK